MLLRCVRARARELSRVCDGAQRNQFRELGLHRFHQLMDAGPQIDAPRLMLHATELGFEHPQTGELKVLTEPPPEDFQAVLARLRAS